MQISPDQWSQLRRAAFDDDRRTFEAVVSLIVRQAIQKDAEVRQIGTPYMPDGRPWLASAR